MKKLNKILKSIGLLILKLMDDILLCSGITLLSIGVFLIYIPAGYIVLGTLLIAFAFLVAKRGG